MGDNVNEYMKIAIMESNKGSSIGDGGPFGAVIVDKNGNVVASSHNKVLINNDPTAHAEVETIREACKILNTYDLSECVMYTSCEPCPMCLSAIIWANIKEVYYACTKDDAKDIGFRDDMIYDFIKQKIENKDSVLKLNKMGRDEAVKVFKEYKKNNKKIY